MTAAISAEVASDNVLVNSVAPGFVDTELTRNVLGLEGMKKLAVKESQLTLVEILKEFA